MLDVVHIFLSMIIKVVYNEGYLKIEFSIKKNNLAPASTKKKILAPKFCKKNNLAQNKKQSPPLNIKWSAPKCNLISAKLYWPKNLLTAKITVFPSDDTVGCDSQVVD